MTTRDVTASRKCVPASPYGGRDAVGRTCNATAAGCGGRSGTQWDAVENRSCACHRHLPKLARNEDAVEPAARRVHAMAADMKAIATRFRGVQYPQPAGGEVERILHPNRLARNV